MKKLLILFFAFISILSFGQTRLTYDTVKLQYIKGKIAHVIYIGDTLIFPNGTKQISAGGTGTVTSFGFTNTPGVSGTVTNLSTSPNLTLAIDSSSKFKTQTQARADSVKLHNQIASKQPSGSYATTNDTVGGSGTMPKLTTQKQLNTAISGIVTTNYLNDTINGSGSTPKLATQKYVLSQTPTITPVAPFKYSGGTASIDTGYHKGAAASFYLHQKDSAAIVNAGHVYTSTAPIIISSYNITADTSKVKGRLASFYLHQKDSVLAMSRQAPISATSPILFSANTVSADSGYHKGALTSYYQHQKDSILIAGKAPTFTATAPIKYSSNVVSADTGWHKNGLCSYYQHQKDSININNNTYIWSTGLTNTSGTITSNISTGVSGGQTIYGGTGANDNLTLKSTTNATKGFINFGTLSQYNDATGNVYFGGSYLGIGTSNQSYNLTFGNANGNQSIGCQLISYGSGKGLNISAGSTAGGGSPFTAITGTGTTAIAVCVNSSNGDIWSITSGGIYKNAGGSGSFSLITNTITASTYSGIAVNSSNGDVWAVVNTANATVYHYTIAGGSFTAYTTSLPYNATCITVNSSNNDVFVGNINETGIYKNAGGNSTFTVFTSGAGHQVSGIAVNSSNGDLWIGDPLNLYYLYHYTTSSGVFTSVGLTYASYCGITVNSSTGDVWYSGNTSDFYKSSGGTGPFTAQGVYIPYADAMYINSSSGDIFVAVRGAGGIYKASGATNQQGGDLSLSTGSGTGNAVSAIHFYISSVLSSGSINQSLNEVARFTGAGYLGINSTTPQFYLDVNGSTRIAGSNGLYFGGTTTSASDYSHSIYNSSGNLIIQPRVDAVSAITFESAGNNIVANINTTNQSLEAGLWFKKSKGANVASATTITPTAMIFHVTGTTTIATLNVPYASWTGQLFLIPDGLWSTTTGGNIALGSTAVVNKVLVMTYDGTFWYPSY